MVTSASAVEIGLAAVVGLVAASLATVVQASVGAAAFLPWLASLVGSAANFGAAAVPENSVLLVVLTIVRPLLTHFIELLYPVVPPIISP